MLLKKQLALVAISHITDAIDQQTQSPLLLQSTHNQRVRLEHANLLDGDTTRFSISCAELWTFQTPCDERQGTSDTH